MSGRTEHHYLFPSTLAPLGGLECHALQYKRSDTRLVEQPVSVPLPTVSIPRVTRPLSLQRPLSMSSRRAAAYILPTRYQPPPSYYRPTTRWPAMQERTICLVMDEFKYPRPPLPPFQPACIIMAFFLRIRCVHLRSLPVSMCAGLSGFSLSSYWAVCSLKPRYCTRQASRPAHRRVRRRGTGGVRACFKAAVAEVVMCVRMMMVLLPLPSR